MSASQPQSLWLSSASQPIRPFFNEFGPFDVVVVGGGIAGLCTAYHLQANGRKVAVLERGKLVGGVTGHTTAKVTSLHDLRYRRIMKDHGADKAYAYADANQWAIEWLFETADRLEIDCDLARDFACTFSIRSEDRDAFEEERDVCRRLSLPLVSLPDARYPVRFAHSVAIGNQGRFHPVKFLSALADYLVWQGVAIFENSPVEAIDEDETGVSFEVGGRSIRADKLVVATNYPIFDSGMFIARLAPYRSYAMAVETHDEIPDGMFIATDEKMPSWRKHTGNIVIVGYGCHKVGQEADTEGQYRALERWAQNAFPVRDVLARWSTQDNRTPDGLPYIGRSPNQEHIYLATGFDGWGMTTGMAGGKLIADLICDKRNVWEDVFKPGRFRLPGTAELIKANANAFSHLLGDKFKSVQNGHPEDLTADQAGIFETPAGRVAAYRNPEGALQCVSSECTHVGCQVAWNPAERSWDCPCHGSRFRPDGTVIHGPAMLPLEPMNPDPPFLTVGPDSVAINEESA